jgi:diaminopimelate epimerase
MQACGNDFVVIDHLAGIPKDFTFSTEIAARICDRHFGIGCDQLLWLKPLAGRDAAVEIYNTDGSIAEMCGNGMRAIGVHLALRGPNPGKKNYTIRTEAGEASRDVAINLSGPHPEVALGTPTIVRLDEELETYGSFTRVDIGNPHAIFFNDAVTIDGIALAFVGPSIESSPTFPNRTNVEFAAVLGRRKIRVRVWERGAGITLACGSGACAVVAAAEAKKLVDPGEKIEVVLPGGSVFVRLEAGWAQGRGQALLSGPAEDSFAGEWSPR